MRAAAGASVGFVLGLLVACSPAQRETVREVAPPATRALCVLLRAFTSSGTVDEVCATAEDLAPFVSEILAQHAAREGREGAAVPPGVALAFSMPAPARPVPRRRCVSWVTLSTSKDAGIVSDGAVDGDSRGGTADGGAHGE
jgi:hypothetical protein